MSNHTHRVQCFSDFVGDVDLFRSGITNIQGVQLLGGGGKVRGSRRGTECNR